MRIPNAAQLHARLFAIFSQRHFSVITQKIRQGNDRWVQCMWVIFCRVTVAIVANDVVLGSRGQTTYRSLRLKRYNNNVASFLLIRVAFLNCGSLRCPLCVHSPLGSWMMDLVNSIVGIVRETSICDNIFKMFILALNWPLFQMTNQYCNRYYEQHFFKVYINSSYFYFLLMIIAIYFHLHWK